MRQTGWYQVLIANPYRINPIPKFVWYKAWWEEGAWWNAPRSLDRPYHPTYFQHAVHDVRQMPTASGTTQ